MQSNQGAPQNQPRHWHGPAGNRHEQQNVWVVGGTPQPYVASRDPWSPAYNPLPSSTTPTRTSAKVSETTGTAPAPAPAPASTTGPGPTSGPTSTAIENANMATPRRDSESATSGTSSVYSPNANERRRSSAASAGGSPTLFSTLSNQKRNSADPAMAARRASWTEQAQKGNFFARWWNGYTRGQ